jgi:hypothetical protein
MGLSDVPERCRQSAVWLSGQGPGMEQIASCPLSLVKGEFLWSSSRVLLAGNTARTLHSPTSKKCSHSVSLSMTTTRNNRNGDDSDDNDAENDHPRGTLSVHFSEFVNGLDGATRLRQKSACDCRGHRRHRHNAFNDNEADVGGIDDTQTEPSTPLRHNHRHGHHDLPPQQLQPHFVNDVVTVGLPQKCLAIAVGATAQSEGAVSVYELDLQPSAAALHHAVDLSRLLSQCCNSDSGTSSSGCNTTPSVLMAVAVSGDHSALAVVHEDGRVVVVDMQTFRAMHSFVADSAGATALSFTADGQLATCGMDFETPLRLFDLRAPTTDTGSGGTGTTTTASQSCREFRRRRGRGGEVKKTVSFSPLRTSAPSRHFQSPTQSPTRHSAVSSPFASTSTSSSPRSLFSSQSTASTMPFCRVQPALSCLKTHPLESKLVTGDSNGAVCLWDLRASASLEFPLHRSIGEYCLFIHPYLLQSVLLVCCLFVRLFVCSFVRSFACVLVVESQ